MRNAQLSQQHIISRLSRAGILVVAALFLARCSPDAPTGTSGSARRTFTVAAGQELEIRLQNIGPGEYRTPPAISAPVVRFQSVSLGDPVPAGLTQLFHFQALRPGRAVITFRHSKQSRIVMDTVIVR